MAKHNLPAEVHDEFRKANLLHRYVSDHFDDIVQWALEIGGHLLAAKSAIPPGRWESECGRLFDGSLRTAQFYMRFARDVSALPKAQRIALLALEGSLTGAAKAAKEAAKQQEDPVAEEESAEEDDATESTDMEASGTEPTGEDDTDAGREPSGEDGSTEEQGKDAPGASTGPPRNGKEKPGTGGPPNEKCPACSGTRWDEDDEGWACSTCHHPYGEPAGDVQEDRLSIQRSKTVKTAEALMRAFDDLQYICPRDEHSRVLRDCKTLLVAAKEWR